MRAAEYRLIRKIQALQGALLALLEQTTDQDTNYGIELTEGEKLAVRRAERALVSSYKATTPNGR